MKKEILAAFAAVMVLVLVCFGLESIGLRSEKAKLIKAVDTAYQEAKTGNPIQPKENWRIMELYFNGRTLLTKEEHATLDQKIKVVALAYVDQLYEQANDPEEVVTYEETWATAPLYDFAVRNATDSERDELDRKLDLIAEAYYAHQYESKAPKTSDPREGIDDNGWKANIRSAFIPRAKELRGDAPAGPWAGPKD